MCGLVGVAGKLETADEGLLRRLLVLDYWRGPDSTGMASIRIGNEVRIAKIASHPFNLFDTKRFNDAQAGFQSKAFIGHNRSATTGAVTEVNAHPFQFDHIVGAHNGTLSTKSKKDLEEACGESFNVDSQAIFACIAKIGLADTVPLLQGAWALTYVDLEENTLNFLRNKERSFYYSVSEDFKKVIWASEYDMIGHACKGSERVKEQPLYRDAQGYRFYETEVDLHYKFNLQDLRDATELVKPTVRVLKGKEPPKVVANNKGEDPFGREIITDLITEPISTTSSSTTTSRSKTGYYKESRLDSRCVHLVGHADDPFGGMITRPKFEELAQYGCSFCEKDVAWGDTGVSVFEGADFLLCSDCSRGDGDANRIHVPDVAVYL